MAGLNIGQDIPLSGNKCDQCGLIHPPLPMGQRCPNAKVEVKGVDPNDVRKFLVDLSNVILFHIESKKISDTKKIFGEITLLIAKYREDNYK